MLIWWFLGLGPLSADDTHQTGVGGRVKETLSGTDQGGRRT